MTDRLTVAAIVAAAAAAITVAAAPARADVDTRSTEVGCVDLNFASFAGRRSL